ncbi:hypothetical protein M408DRAFT_135927 [Serendipita vermifera MAFF 305830]|uniref:Uncharacterized protein n=1 Tax=Serendipita vermifera MAFF 305830 TaxID=933852 RepID=A0A0C2WS73_SERVB|nr:hypothetical protein M408DRAFT_135927 [Serendipita vermifera MAFF 305830]
MNMTNQLIGREVRNDYESEFDTSVSCKRSSNEYNQVRKSTIACAVAHPSVCAKVCTSDRLAAKGGVGPRSISVQICAPRFTTGYFGLHRSRGTPMPPDHDNIPLVRQSMRKYPPPITL